MFKKNDLILKIADVVLYAVAALTIIGCIVWGIIYMWLGYVAYGVIILIGGIIGGLLEWLFFKTIICCMCDIKFIRNKLYDLDNKNLSGFLYDDNADKEYDDISRLVVLKKLLDKGALTQEEYETEKKKILDQQ